MGRRKPKYFSHLEYIFPDWPQRLDHVERLLDIEDDVDAPTLVAARLGPAAETLWKLLREIPHAAGAQGAYEFATGLPAPPRDADDPRWRRWIGLVGRAYEWSLAYPSDDELGEIPSIGEAVNLVTAVRRFVYRDLEEALTPSLGVWLRTAGIPGPPTGTL